MLRTNIQEKLITVKRKENSSEAILREVNSILKQLRAEHDKIKKTIGAPPPKNENAFDPNLLVSEEIFNIQEIKKISIAYRLRFLDSNLFRGTIPIEALSKIRHLEKEHQTQLTGFKILAPSKMFKLKDRDDPILFAPIGNGYYYLIHKWGNDLHPLRKLKMWPIKNVVNLVWFLLLISYFMTLLIQSTLFVKSISIAEFGVLFFFMFKSAVAVIIFYGFSKGKNFSNAIWNSKYINT